MIPLKLQRDDASCSSSSSHNTHSDDLSFTNLDFDGVNFDHTNDDNDNDDAVLPSKSILSNNDKLALSYERRIIDNNDIDHRNGNKNDNDNDERKKRNDNIEDDDETTLYHITEFYNMINDGRYLDVLHSSLTIQILSGTTKNKTTTTIKSSSEKDNIEGEEQQQRQEGLVETIHDRIVSYCTSVSSCVIVELIGIASLSLFLQLNYTGPTFDESSSSPEWKRLEDVNPHFTFRCRPSTCDDDDGDDYEGETTKRRRRQANNGSDATTMTRNMILSELEVDGDLPFGLCDGPYFLLLSRAIFSTLAMPLLVDRVSGAGDTSTTTILGESWSSSLDYWLQRSVTTTSSKKELSLRLTSHLSSSLYNWNARATIAHQRTLPVTSSSIPSPTLWKEVLFSFDVCLSDDDGVASSRMARMTLEWGLAQHYFERDGRGISSFRRAEELSGLTTNITGAEGKRTKFQQKATAQMIVTTATTSKSNPAAVALPSDDDDDIGSTHATPTAIPLSDDTHLLERVSYTDPTLNTSSSPHHRLSKLHLSILLALCLDVRNVNPSGNEDLTAEQMTAYLDRIIHATTSSQSHDWTIYSTALLERAWLEHSRPNRKERSILQIQALFDQHTSRLTLTQSTTESAVTNAATAPSRLATIHVVVYPPRWELQKDLADRYARMGMLTTAAELYRELECWDEVVDCLKAAGREGEARSLVEDRLRLCGGGGGTPRLWCAHGDLRSNDEEAISSYERAVAVSRERYAPAYEKWGRRHFDGGRLEECLPPWTKCLELKPLQPQLWFTRGTVHMRLSQWDEALRCFSEVVVQEPEEGDAWSNIAAVHMQRKDSYKAYGAIQESLKRFRKNWRVWMNKLYVCLDLKKYDEAVQACQELIGFYKTSGKKDEGMIEEKCVKAIVVGSLKGWEEAVGARHEEVEDEEVVGDEEERTEDVVDQNYNVGNDNDDESSSNDDDEDGSNTTNNSNASSSSDTKKRNAAIASWKRTLSRVKTLLDELTTTLSHPWIFETKAYFDARLGQSSSIVLENLQKEYRALQAQDGWEMDGDALRKIVVVAEQMVDCYVEMGGREGLAKGRYMLKALISKIRGGYLEDDVPEEVEVLRMKLDELTKLIKESQS